jgi:hypothetical protein
MTIDIEKLLRKNLVGRCVAKNKRTGAYRGYAALERIELEAKKDALAQGVGAGAGAGAGEKGFSTDWGVPPWKRLMGHQKEVKTIIRPSKTHEREMASFALPETPMDPTGCGDFAGKGYGHGLSVEHLKQVRGFNVDLSPYEVGTKADIAYKLIYDMDLPFVNLMGVYCREYLGYYNLTDLHTIGRFSINRGPGYYFKNEVTKGVVAVFKGRGMELEEGAPVFSKGKYGTFAIKELAIGYLLWIDREDKYYSTLLEVLARSEAAMEEWVKVQDTWGGGVFGPSSNHVKIEVIRSWKPKEVEGDVRYSPDNMDS